MKKLFSLILVICSLLGGNAYSANLNLECYGVGSTIGSITKYDQNTGVTTGSNYKKEIKSI